ncbi:MAG: hypothetical protein H0U75_10695 [Legionella sp.]|nr:hypothetical protein [Legionella sp.]
MKNIIKMSLSCLILTSFSVMADELTTNQSPCSNPKLSEPYKQACVWSQQTLPELKNNAIQK